MQKIYRWLIQGFLALLPISITVQLLFWMASLGEDLFGSPIAAILPQNFYLPGMGILIAVVVVILVGILVNNYFTSGIFVWMESQLTKIPFVNAIYNPVRDIMNMFRGDHTMGTKRVVMVRITESTEAVGLVTRDQFDDLKVALDRNLTNDLVAVYIPFSYALGGMTILVHRSHVRETKLKPQQALQLAITGWIKGSDQALPGSGQNPAPPAAEKSL